MPLGSKLTLASYSTILLDYVTAKDGRIYAQKRGDLMKIVIYGAGAVGGVVGGNLAAAGKDVVLIGRSQNVKVMNERGLRLVTPSGSRTACPSLPGPIASG